MHICHIEMERAIRRCGIGGKPPSPELGNSPRWLLITGAGWFRIGDWLSAAKAFVSAEDDKQIGDLARSWAALALARAGRFEDALARLDQPDWLRAEILCASGERQAGLTEFRQLMADEPRDWKALRFADRLVEAGQVVEAATWLDRRLERASRYRFELWAAAVRCWCLAKRPARAWRHLEADMDNLPGLAADLVRDPCFGRLRKAAPQIKKLRNRGFGWLPWPVEKLAIAGVYWLTEAESADHAPEYDGTAPLGVLPGPAMWPALNEGRLFRPAAQVLLTPSGTGYWDHPSLLMFHPGKPDRIYLCLNDDIPAYLWPSAAATVDGLTGLLAPYPRGPAAFDPLPAALSRRWECFLGPGPRVPSPYSGELEPLELHAFARVAVSSPFVEDFGWGSACEGDPMVDFLDTGGIDHPLVLRQLGHQDPEQLSSTSYRLRWSRGIVKLLHGPAGFAMNFYYEPNPHPGSVETINERFATRFPKDLPLDAVGVVMHFDGAPDVASLRESIHGGLSGHDLWKLDALGMLLHDRPEMGAFLAGLQPNLRRDAYSLAWTYNRLDWLLSQALTDERLRGHLQVGPHVSVLEPEPLEDELGEGGTG